MSNTNGKTVVLIGDGMSDEPIASLGNRSPLEAAETPCMDELARIGDVGLSHNVPPGMEPGSDVAIMSIMGYDPALLYSGRGPIEAASIGIPIAQDESAFRCNLITLQNGILKDYSGGHISTEDSGELIVALKAALDREGVSFHHGVSFRNILKLRGDFTGLRTHAPHDHLDEPADKYLPSGPGSEILIELMEQSKSILSKHSLNERNIQAGHSPANCIWPWSGGKLPDLFKYAERFGVSGTVVSAVDLVQGLGKMAGLTVVKVPGATGMVDTNYEGKLNAALEAIETQDFVLVHIEGTDESAHMGDLELKMEGIRRFDSLIVKPISDHLKKLDDFRLLVLPDHPTPIRIRTHTSEPVPFIALDTRRAPRFSAPAYSEKGAAATGLTVRQGHTLLETLITGRPFA